MTIRQRISDAEWQARLDLAACYRLVARYGMADLIYNRSDADMMQRARALFRTLTQDAARIESVSAIDPSGCSVGLSVVAGAPARSDTFILVNVDVGEKKLTNVVTL